MEWDNPLFLHNHLRSLYNILVLCGIFIKLQLAFAVILINIFSHVVCFALLQTEYRDSWNICIRMCPLRPLLVAFLWKMLIYSLSKVMGITDKTQVTIRDTLEAANMLTLETGTRLAIFPNVIRYRQNYTRLLVNSLMYLILIETTLSSRIILVHWTLF